MKLKNGVELTGISVINENLSVHNLIYKITNNINGHYYIGKHSTRNPFDNYMGSGIILRDAKNSYGLSAFSKEILFDFENVNDSYLKETELIQLSNCHDINKNCYNMKPGGYGGSTSESSLKGAQTRKLHGYKCTKETKYKMSQSSKGIKKSLKHKQHLSDNHKTRKEYIIENEITHSIEYVVTTIPPYS